tara:strand:- start:1796 stop:2254 length:459 start_codon:yes stop_codon:yes gene_type:complete
MGFTAFKNAYKSRMENGPFFESTDECADFIADEYHSSIFSSPGGAAGPIVSGVTANAGTLSTALKGPLSAQLPLVGFELALSGALAIYWAGAIMTTPGYVVSVPGVPVAGILSQADSVDQFLDQLVGVFETHLGGLVYVHPTSSPLSGFSVP